MLMYVGVDRLIRLEILSRHLESARRGRGRQRRSWREKERRRKVRHQKITIKDNTDTKECTVCRKGDNGECERYRIGVYRPDWNGSRMRTLSQAGGGEKRRRGSGINYQQSAGDVILRYVCCVVVVVVVMVMVWCVCVPLVLSCYFPPSLYAKL